jgi:hypothetical protein
VQPETAAQMSAKNAKSENFELCAIYASIIFLQK